MFLRRPSIPWYELVQKPVDGRCTSIRSALIGVCGLSDEEALPLLDVLLQHAVRPQQQYVHRWLPGDLTLWDNRCLLHKANGDYDMSELRYLYRVMLRGDAPF